MTRSQLHIGEIAQLLGVTPKTVRHYHKLGLIAEPKRSEGGYRLYSAADLMRLQRIRRLQALGLSLAHIKHILDAPDPDALLSETLNSVLSDIRAEQDRLEARRQRIEAYVAEGATLAEVLNPPQESPTYQMLESAFGGKLPLASEFLAFDKALLAQLDAFHWPESYYESWKAVVEHFAAYPEHYHLFQKVGERMSALADMPEDAPEIEAWVAEIAHSDALRVLLEISHKQPTPSLEKPLAETVQQVIEHFVQGALSPAQRRFFMLLSACTEEMVR